MRRLAPSQMRQLALRANHGPSRCLRASRGYSTETAPAPPPLLSKLKADLKTAMRAKDAPRLSVLRSVLAATTNAAKTSSPIATDLQLIALLRKTARGNQEAIEEAKKANRADLVDKEEAQVKVIDEYIAESGVQVLSEEEIRVLVQDTISQGQQEGKDSNQIFKELMSSKWVPEGKLVDKATLGRIATELVRKK